ncbi:MAG: hypothetical protein ACI9UJ_002336 [bacterium]|jgi:hypothetical protein
MDAFASFIIAIQGLIFLAGIVAIIWLIVRRVRMKKEEQFEKRDN